jgi:hypothetical protein
MGEHAYFSRSKAYSHPIDLYWLVLSVNQGWARCFTLVQRFVSP